MKFRDPVIQTIHNLKQALALEMKRCEEFVEFYDVNLGKRKLCTTCGVTADTWDNTSIRHQNWCRVGMALKAIEDADLYVGIPAYSQVGAI